MTDLIEEITPSSAAKVRLPYTSRFDNRLLANHVRAYPRMAVTTPDGRQYAIAGPWRHRDDIAELIETTRGGLRTELLETLLTDLGARGFALIVLDYGVEAKDPDYYRRNGFRLIERILEYDRPNVPVQHAAPPAGFEVRPYQLKDRDDVLRVERVSFPWMWWNSEEEWDRYTVSPGVEILVGGLAGSIIGYAGFVVHRHAGHLDRLAVRDVDQGRGRGAVLLTSALERMVERGATQVSLTTQEHNLRSQRLYERNGFHRGRWTYEIYGRWLNQAQGIL
jgi:ribosomal protein S18 acetylase RimI-like enzyme